MLITSIIDILAIVENLLNIMLIFFLFLVGNKNDCPSRKVVVTEDAQRFANQMNIPLFETSAKENINVEEMFLTITKMVGTFFYIISPDIYQNCGLFFYIATHTS